MPEPNELSGHLLWQKHDNPAQFDLSKQHHKKPRKHKDRPCGNPPALPTGVTLTFQATEALTHLRFTGQVKWTEVSQDIQGHGLKIDHYDVECLPCNAGGTPVDLDGSDWRIRHHVKQPVQELKIKAATNPSGTTFRYVTRNDHGQSSGNKITVSGCKSPTTYNGTFTIVTIVDSTTLEVNGGSSGVAACDEPGKMQDADDRLHIIFTHIPRPKTWYFKARVRAVDRSGCIGNWGAWTSPVLPWTGADPEPPTPTFTDPGALTFDRKNRSKHHKLRALFTFNDMAPWDVPGGDHEDDLDRYEVQIDRSDDGVTFDGKPFPHQFVPARRNAGSGDAEGDDQTATRTAIFHGGYVQRRYWYRCRVRSFDRFNRPGDWSGWCTPAFPFDDTQPPTPLLVRVHSSATDRVVLDWDDPLVYIPVRGTWTGTSGTATLTGSASPKATVEVERGSLIRIDSVNYTVKHTGSTPGTPSDTVLTLTTNLSTSPSALKLYLVEDDPDVAYYFLQIAKAGDVTTGSPDQYNVIYAKDRARGNRKAFKILDADKGNTFYARVRSVDAAFNRSQFVAAKLDPGNSSTSAGGDGVVIGAAGSGKTKVVWHVFGRLRQLTELQTHDYDIDEGLTFTKLRVRVKDVATGQSIKVTPYKNGSALAQTTLPAGDRRVANDAYSTAFADADRLSFSIDQVGSTFPGKQLTVIAVFVPT